MRGATRAGTAAAHRADRTNLVLWLLGPLFELPGIALLSIVSTDLGADTPFGSSGTATVSLAALVATVAGVVIAWFPGTAPPWLRRSVVALLLVNVGLLVVLTLSFLSGSEYPIMAILLGHSALGLGMIARFAHRAGGAPPTAN